LSLIHVYFFAAEAIYKPKISNLYIQNFFIDKTLVEFEAGNAKH